MSAPVVIVGGGFSGAMLAARLAETGQAAIVIERSGDFARGVAYGTPQAEHLLNVRSARMGAVDGRPDDFVRWLAARHPDQADPEGFAPRCLYGAYLSDRLTAVEASQPGRVRRETGEAVAVEGTAVRLSDGRVLAGRAVVLATGNPAPATAAGDTADARVLSDPWRPGALEAIGAGDEVLIVGTGLTMVDVLLTLTGRGWRGRATAISLAGLLPLPHGDHHDTPAPLDPALVQGPLSRRLLAARRLARAAGWRPVMEALRPVTADLWRQADATTRVRFLRRVRPFWDVHRHRIAPSVHDAIATLIDKGRLTIRAGRVAAIRREGDRVLADWTSGAGISGVLAGDRLIDCSGPGYAPGREPLTAGLIAAGRARMDALGLGFELDDQGRVIDRNGDADPSLFVLGPPARGAFWETTAVPDIRKRIEAVVRDVAGLLSRPEDC